MVLYVTKRDGSRQPYSEQKVIDSISRTNRDPMVIRKVLEGLQPTLKENVTTDEIYERIAQLLKKVDITYEYRFRLKEALGKLSDEGERFEFEKFIQNLFQEEGYEAVWQPSKAQGMCIEHQIDVYLPKERVLVECKHHRNENRMTGLGDVLETWARLYDVKEGFKKGVPGSIDIRDFWLVVNTKFSEHAKKYAKCKGMVLVGWATDVRSLDKMIERTKCFPITILPITDKEHDILGSIGAVSTKSFENLYKINDRKLFSLIPKKRLDDLYALCQKL